MREKKCNECENEFKKLFRIKYKELHHSNKIWLFVCEKCLKLVKEKAKEAKLRAKVKKVAMCFAKVLVKGITFTYVLFLAHYFLHHYLKPLKKLNDAHNPNE